MQDMRKEKIQPTQTVFEATRTTFIETHGSVST
jgi:hypothetical protein